MKTLSEMDLQFPISLISFFIILFLLLFKRSSSKNQKLPPGPRKLPIIGNILELAGEVQHRVLRDLSQKHGPLMHLQLAEIPAIVVSSSRVAKEVFKTHDLAFSDRAQIQLSRIAFRESKDIVFNVYDDYWRQMRKLCTVELLTTSKVNSFRSIREDEAWNLVESIKASLDSPINLTHKFSWLTNSITCRAAIGNKSKYQDDLVNMIDRLTALGAGFDIADLFPSYKFLHVFSGLKSRVEKVSKDFDFIFDNIMKEHIEKRAKTKTKDGRVEGMEDLVDVLLRVQDSGDLQIPITSSNMQGVIGNMLTAGTDTSSKALDWAMSELVRNPQVMEKAQAEVRKAFRGKSKIHEADLEGLSYLKLVVKETLRLHPPGPLLVPKECREQCEIDGYTIPVGTKLIVNAWAIGRDPEYWESAESFQPERFEGKSIGYNGTNLNYIPFGAGRRSCPGITFGIASIELPLASLLYHFNWKIPNGIKPDDFDMDEVLGVTLTRKNSLLLTAIPYNPTDDSS